MSDKEPLRIELSKETYEALKAIAEANGSSVPEVLSESRHLHRLAHDQAYAAKYYANERYKEPGEHLVILTGTAGSERYRYHCIPLAVLRHGCLQDADLGRKIAAAITPIPDPMLNMAVLKLTSEQLQGLRKGTHRVEFTYWTVVENNKQSEVVLKDVML